MNANVNSAVLPSYIPKAAVTMLKIIRQDYPDAFLAGGFLRDTMLEVPPKDMDFFTFMTPKAEDQPEMDKKEYIDQRIDGVVKRKGWELPVDIIFLNSNVDIPAVAVSQFALGIQQIWYDGIFLNRLPPFWDDMRYKRFSVQRCDSENEAFAIARKMTALEEKYPGWGRRIPERYKAYKEILESKIGPLVPGSGDTLLAEAL
jgi:hypothetical protein